MQINKIYCLSLFAFVSLLSACGGRQSPAVPQVIVPAISVQITRENCPSIEARPDMEISWMNIDNVDLVLLIEHEDAQGVNIDTGGTDLLQPGATFSITSLSPGEYNYYCTKDRSAFGTILVIE